MMSEIFNAVLRPISCECIANFCNPTPIELIQLGIKTRSNRWSIDFPWLFTKFRLRPQILNLCTYFELWNPYFMLKNLVFALKNPYFTTDFPDIKIIAELTNLYFKSPKIDQIWIIGLISLLIRYYHQSRCFSYDWI